MAIYKRSELKGILKVGDKVAGTGYDTEICSGLKKGVIGEITKIEGNKYYINNCSHSFTYTDWNGVEGTLEILEQINPSESVATTPKKTSKMQKLTATFKRLTDKPTQTLFKAGFVDGDLELTEAGREALLSLMLAENKEALVALAQEAIDEEKEDK